FLRIFLWDGPHPHYQIDPQAPFLDVAGVMRQRAAAGRPPAPPSPLGGEGPGVRGAAPPPEATLKGGWDRAGDGIAAEANSRPATVLVAADHALNETFHDGDAVRRGLIAALPDLFNESGALTVHARPPGGAEWVHVGELQRPADKKAWQPGQERVT